MRAQIVAQIKDLYYVRDYLVPCPGLNETYEWRMMQISDEPCPESGSNEATCTLGRMQIKTRRTSPDGSVKTVFNHATVMGCARRELLSRVRSAYQEGSACYLLNKNLTDVGMVRSIEVEHCREVSSMCFDKDYCVDWKKSEIKSWVNSKDEARFDMSLKIGMLVVVVVVITALLIAGMFFEPASRPSNVPKAIGDESEVVKVLNVREKDTSSIEVFEGTGTIPRRPTHPPPPPPRLSRDMRGGTPV